MNGTQIILIVVATIFFCALSFLGAFLVWRYLTEKNRREKERDDLLRELVPALKQFIAAVEPFSVLPKTMEGLIAVCRAQVVEITKFREASQVIAGILGQKPPKDELLTQTEEDAYRAGRKQEYMIRGLSPDEADTQLAVDEQSRIFGGGDPSVMGGLMET